ncbi:MAG: maleylacetoacetate isomerase [Rhodobacteraceae bacterium]|nr:maleylacetoacetate isomerase [Paracoccaceae bacterium]
MRAILYDYWRSSAAYRLRIALGLAGIEFESRQVDLLSGEHKGEQYLDHNPQGLVPTLYLDGRKFSQSLAAIEFMNDTGLAKFLPEDPSERARVRTISYAVAMEIHPVCNLSVSLRAAKLANRDDADVEWMRHFMSVGFDGVERLLRSFETRHYCHGDSPTMADICLLPQVYNARRRGVPVRRYKQIASIAARLQRLDAFAEAHPDNFKPGADND